MTDPKRTMSTHASSVFSSAFCSVRARPYLLTSAILASALGFIDGTAVAIALPSIRDSLDTSLSGAQWIANAYMLTLSALILVGGAAGDRFGIARVFGAGIATFVVTSLACGLAPNAEVLIVARAFQGVGAALMIPGSLALIAQAYPEGERGRAIGIWASASAVTTAAGPLLGGALLSVGGAEIWRALFLINLPLGALALILLKTHVQDDAGSTNADRPDLAGAALIALALGLIAFALTAGGHSEGSPNPDTFADPGPAPRSAAFAAVAGVALLGVFLAVERRAAAPMLPLSLFANRAFSAANAVTFALYFALSAVLFYLPMTLIAGWGETPLMASLVFLPLSVAIGLLSPAAGRIADRTGPRAPIAGGASLVATGYAVMALAAPAQNFWGGILPGATLAGFGMALVVAPLSTAIMASVSAHSTGAASGVNNAVSRIAGLFAVAAFGPVVAQVYACAGGAASFGAMASDPGHAEAMSFAFSAVAGTAAAIAGLSALTAWVGLAQERSVRR